MKTKLSPKELDLELLDLFQKFDKWFNRYHLDWDKQKKIIGEMLLGWKKYEMDTGQYVYAPDEETAKTIRCGDNITRFIDEKIKDMIYGL